MQLAILALFAVLAALGFYLLYFVIRAAVRDGIRLARESDQGTRPPDKYFDGRGESRAAIYHPDDER